MAWIVGQPQESRRLQTKKSPIAGAFFRPQSSAFLRLTDNPSHERTNI
jgi:hypothetical protein